jgi:hypothetical protein
MLCNCGYFNIIAGSAPISKNGRDAVSGRHIQRHARIISGMLPRQQQNAKCEPACIAHNASWGNEKSEYSAWNRLCDGHINYIYDTCKIPIDCCLLKNFQTMPMQWYAQVSEYELVI